MKNKLIRVLTIIFSFLVGTIALSETTFAASFALAASTSEVAPGGSFSISVGGDCTGRVNLKIAGGTLSDSAVWVENGYTRVSVTAGSSGTVTITATPEPGFSDADAEDYNPGSRTVSVKIVAPSQPTTKPSTPTTNTPKPSNSSQSTSNSTRKPATNSTQSANDNPTPDDETTSSAGLTEANQSSDESDDTNIDQSEPATSTTETETPDPCAKISANNKLAWTLVIILTVAFCIASGALIYTLLQFKKLQSSKTTKPKSSTHAKTRQNH